MKSLKGKLLIATPNLHDPNFARTVLLMFEHTEEGAAGVILNRPTEATITDLSEQVFQEPFEWDKPISLGGPVPGPLVVFHEIEDLADQEVIDGVYQTIDAAKIQQLLRQRPEPSLIVANCAGWGPGQLEGEIEADAWISRPATSEHVFWEGSEDLWEVMVKGVNTSQLSELLGLRIVPEDPSLN